MSRIVRVPKEIIADITLKTSLADLCNFFYSYPELSVLFLRDIHYVKSLLDKHHITYWKVKPLTIFDLIRYSENSIVEEIERSIVSKNINEINNYSSLFFTLKQIKLDDLDRQHQNIEDDIGEYDCDSYHEAIDEVWRDKRLVNKDFDNFLYKAINTYDINVALEVNRLRTKYKNKESKNISDDIVRILKYIIKNYTTDEFEDEMIELISELIEIYKSTTGNRFIPDSIIDTSIQYYNIIHVLLESSSKTSLNRLLIVAASWGEIELAEQLIELGADNVKDALLSAQYENDEMSAYLKSLLVD